MNFCLPGVVKIPARNTFAEGAMLEPVNTVLKAVRRLRLLKGDVVLVAGQGPIGLMFTRLLDLAGVRVLATDLLPERLRLARQFGATWALRPDAVGIDRLVDAKITKGRGLDAAVIAVPANAAVAQAMGWLRGGGQLLLFAHTRRGDAARLDLAQVCVDEKDVIGSYSSDVTLQPEVARLVFSRKLDVRPLLTHFFSLERTAEAVRMAANPSPRALKIAVQHNL
jgi:L-iditol 2-dehydrogenase